MANSENYTPFLSSHLSLSRGLRSYLIDRHYKSRFGDLVPLAIATTLCIKLDILNENDNQLENVPILPRGNAIASLILHRQGEQSPCTPLLWIQRECPLRRRPGSTLQATDQDGISRVPQVVMNNPDNPDIQDAELPHCATKLIQYFRSELLNIQKSIDLPIACTVRKSLFEHSIWKPKKLQSPLNNVSANSNITVPYCGVFRNYDQSYLYFNHMSAPRIFTPIPCTVTSTVNPCKPGKVCLLNCQSAKNKAAFIKDYIVDNDFDIFCVTETLLGTNGRNRAVEKDITPTGYKLLHHPRTHGRGGGVGILYKNNIDIKKTDSSQSFEHLELLLKSNGKWACWKFCIIHYLQ